MFSFEKKKSELEYDSEPEDQHLFSIIPVEWNSSGIAVIERKILFDH